MMEKFVVVSWKRFLELELVPEECNWVQLKQLSLQKALWTILVSAADVHPVLFDSCYSTCSFSRYAKLYEYMKHA